jgi:sec-independent protein translocase protein TatA
MGLDNPIHIAFLLIVLLLVFGAKRLPELGHSLGSGLRGFKQAIGGEGIDTPIRVTVQEPATPQAPLQPPPPASSVQSSTTPSITDSGNRAE